MKNFRILFLSTFSFVIFIVTGCYSVEQPVFGGTITDVDGNIYHTVTIGKQTWMIENLKVTHFNDNTAITMVSDSAAWTNRKSAAYCWYKNDSSTYKSDFGALYNWYAVSTGKLAPNGWHIPTNDEWFTLEQNVSQLNYVSGSLAKILASKNYWISCKTSASIGNNSAINNSSGFTALPGGWRINEQHTSFTKIDSLGGWWSSTAVADTTAYALSMMNTLSTVNHSPLKRHAGLSIRCVKN
jgi:uncharacterized protein (TIGR02145 family)